MSLSQETRSLIAKLLEQAKRFGQGWRITGGSGQLRVICAQHDCPMGAIIRHRVSSDLPGAYSGAKEKYLKRFPGGIRPGDGISPMIDACAEILVIPHEVASLIANAADGEIHDTATQEVRQLIEETLLPAVEPQVEFVGTDY